jgi:arylsulfatase
MVSDLGEQFPGYRGFLNRNCITIAELLKTSGYRTAMAGKWHVGGRYTFNEPKEDVTDDPRYPTPNSRGFAKFYGTLPGAGSYFNPFGLQLNGKLVQPESEQYYYTDAVTDFAVKSIQDFSSKKEAFFLFVSYTAPHWPLHALPEDIERYRGKYLNGWDRLRAERYERLVKENIIDPGWQLSPRDENVVSWKEKKWKEWEESRMAVYAAQVDRMDQGIGRILDTLDSYGIKEDTIVLFLSDNGGSAEFLKEDGNFDFVYNKTRQGEQIRIGNIRGLMPGGETTYMSYETPWANVSNTPFRLYKHWVHEGGISTPFICYWPKHCKPNVVHEPLHVVDIMATIADATDADYPSELNGHRITPLEGESFYPLVQEKPWYRDRPICWEHEGNRAVRMREWKLVSKYPGGWELYNMDLDRTELQDISPRKSGLVSQMIDIYQDWADRCNVLPWDEVYPQLGAWYRSWADSPKK